MTRILVYRIGQLGDTVVAVPSLRAIRARFSDARVTLLCDRHAGKGYVLAAEVLEGSGLIDEYWTYPFSSSRAGRILRPLRMLALLARLRAARFDVLVYLAPSVRTPEQTARDKKFFTLAGIRRLIGFEGFQALPRKSDGRPLESVLQEGDLLLGRLAASGIPVPAAGEGVTDLGLGEDDERRVRSWLSRLPNDSGRDWIGVGPGSKVPVNTWPEERFIDTVRLLIERHDLWPVVFGGPQDRVLGERLLRAWGRGYNAAGELPPRATAAALRRCRLYLGQDSGPIHLAAAVGTKCVGIYSSRNIPGLWHPYGKSHRVLRTAIDCEGCALNECIERGMECILAISTNDAVAACDELLARDSRDRSR